MPLPSVQQLLALFQGVKQQHFTVHSLIQHFAVPSEDRPALRRMLRDLVAQGQLLHLHGARYALPKRFNTAIGTVKRHADGYGFVVVEGGEPQADLYIPRQGMGGVVHGDRVMVRLEPGPQRGERRSGRVVQVLERTLHDVTGRIEMLGKACWLMPNDPRLCPEILIPPRERLHVKRGVMAVAEITHFPLLHEHPQGRIVEILGAADDSDMELRLILRKYGLPTAFPPDVDAAAATVPTAVSPHDSAGRRDLRQLVTLTIDGATARDFDDAVSLTCLPNGHVLLGVHIADVSHYVQERSPIDDEASRRGTSVYFPDRVIPMLPMPLSNGICCLQPGVDRLALSVCIELTAQAHPVRYELVDTIIHSQARLTYTQVAAYLDGEPQALAGHPTALGPILEHMDQLATELRRQRFAAGSLDIDLPEADIVLDDAGRIAAIVRAEHTRAHILIEEFMLLANRTVARHLTHCAVPALYRVHAAPTPEQVAQLATFVRTFGYTIADEGRLQPRAVQALLAAVQDTPEAQLINQVLLRALPRAQYAVDNIGHFGLAFSHYTHFTSPIRRYPDLLVHRLLRDTMRPGGMSDARRAWWTQHLPALAESTSARERLADEASREVVTLKKVEFMLDKLGEEYAGVITGVTHFGLFVELTDLFVEGLVHISTIPEYCTFHEDRFCLVAERTGQRYRLGDHVRVRVENVSLARKQIDFTLLVMI